MDLNLSLLLPEYIIAGFLVLILLRELFGKSEKAPFTPAWIATLGAAGAIAGVITLLKRTEAAFGGMFILDPFASFFKILFAVAAIAVIQMARLFFSEKFRNLPEFFAILLCTLLGFFFLVSANDFLLMFIALEIVTLSFYMMAAYAKGELASLEAGLKYLILGSLASAFVIFGISLLYAVIGSSSFPAIRQFLEQNPSNLVVGMGIFMILAGLGFKAAAFPFQFWVPDVYEGAPTPVVSFLSVASKAAGFAILLRLVFTVFGVFPDQRTCIFSLWALVTLLYGNLGALVQTNIKRLLGYSSIGHAGYLMIGIAAGPAFGVTATLYYLIAYAFATLAAFLVVTIASQKIGSHLISDYRGLGKRSPFLAALLFLSFLSLAGVPPLAGFSGKYFILFAAVGQNLLWLALIGAITVTVSLYYYLNVIRTMYFEESSHEDVFTVDTASKVLLLFLAAGILIAGIWHSPFLSVVKTAGNYLF